MARLNLRSSRTSRSSSFNVSCVIAAPAVPFVADLQSILAGRQKSTQGHGVGFANFMALIERTHELSLYAKQMWMDMNRL
jgi:hypothetical protein